SLLSLSTAATPLDWLMPVLMGAPAGIVHGLGGSAGDRPLFDVCLHDVDEMAGWCMADRADDGRRAIRRTVARCETLPTNEPLAPDDPVVDEVLSRIEYVYPQLASASVRASIAASEFKGAYDFTRNPEQQPDRPREDDFQIPPSKYAALKPATAVHRGVITHRILQHLNFATAVDAAGVASELHRMVQQELVTGEDLAVVDQAALEWFVSTPLAEAIRDTGDVYRREFPYIATESLVYFDRSVGSPCNDQVLVRGIVDGILSVADGIDIVDFKTDAIRAEDVAERAERYRPQMELYARAMARIWRRPVRTCWLVFLTAATVVTWDGLDDS
ncbi:MAG: PD-(D/E)XK nuclease family protein, partial [Phycisphaerae bacterium]